MSRGGGGLSVQLGQLRRRHHEPKPIGPPSQPAVGRHQAAPEHPRQRDVLGVEVFVLAVGGGIDDAQLAERREDDPRCSVEHRVADLDHRRATGAQFQHAAAGAGRSSPTALVSSTMSKA